MKKRKKFVEYFKPKPWEIKGLIILLFLVLVWVGLTSIYRNPLVKKVSSEEYISNASNFAQSGNDFYNFAKNSYESKEYILAKELCNQSRTLMNESNNNLKLFVVAMDKEIDSKYAKVNIYFMVKSLLNAQDNKFQACEFLESAMDKYLVGEDIEGDKLMKLSKEKEIEFDKWMQDYETKKANLQAGKSAI